MPPSTAASAADQPFLAFPDNTGTGVTIAILDRGIDWRSPEFINPDGTTRIRWILDQSGQNWCSPDNPDPVEISADQINAALQSGEDIGFRDAVGHGTATAGLAAGNGSSLDGRYRGVATDADLIIIKATSEGAAAHGSVRAEAAFSGCIDQALDWLDAKITELGQPTVALFNAGTQWGPIDGTSAPSRKIAEVFGPDRPGRVWVASSGDEGGLPNHAGGDYAPGAPLEITFSSEGGSFPSAWYSGDAPASVTVELDDGTVVGPVGPGQTAQVGGVTITQYPPGQEFYPWQSTSGDHAVWMNLANPGSGVIRFEALEGSGRADLYGDLLGRAFLTSSIVFNDHLVPGRVNDVTSTLGVIGACVYVARDQYVDIQHGVHQLAAEGATGDLWLKSSGGPTRDGRMPVDVCAPGQNAYAPLATDSAWSTIPTVLPVEGVGRYVVFGGTSAAGPIVAGTVALMLERNPKLTADQVREILHATAVADEYTGEVPNPDWGYGKLDIVAAVEAAGG